MSLASSANAGADLHADRPATCSLLEVHRDQHGHMPNEASLAPGHWHWHWRACCNCMGARGRQGHTDGVGLASWVNKQTDSQPNILLVPPCSSSFFPRYLITYLPPLRPPHALNCYLSYLFLPPRPARAPSPPNSRNGPTGMPQQPLTTTLIGPSADVLQGHAPYRGPPAGRHPGVAMQPARYPAADQ